MKRSLLIIICVLTGAINLSAQSEEEQVLVFRHSGEVNLFYASQLDSIVLSPYDCDSVLHEKMVSQLFYAKDTTLLVPIAEIDSVAFGSRNEIEMRSDVREMTAGVDLPWIIRFDGNSIFYRLNTPATILPKVGERLFYGLDGSDPETAVFPYGLTAIVTAVTTLSNEIRVDIETVGLNDIFKKFFYAGPVSEQVSAPINQRRAPIHTELDGNITLPIGENGQFGMTGNLTVDGQAVLNPFSNYNALDLDIDWSIGFNVSVKSTDSGECHLERSTDYHTLATLYKILNLRGAVGGFVDMAAELTIGLDFQRTFHQKIMWIRRGDEQTWEYPALPVDTETDDQVNVDLTLSGNIYLGGFLGLEISTVGQLIGARGKAKVGEEFEGKVNAQLLNGLREYNPQLYGQATLSRRHRIGLQGFIINRTLDWQIEEHQVADFNWRFGYHDINLFPNYRQTRGVQYAQPTETEVSVSTKSDNEIAHEVETGFEIVDKSGEAVDSVFVDKIVAGTKEIQGVTTTFELPKQYREEELKVRPVFHYAGYTIRAQEAAVLQEPNIQPIMAYGTNGIATYISGATVIGTAKNDSTVINIGNFLPVPIRDTVFVKDPPVINIGKFFTDNDRNELTETWIGEIDGGTVTIVFEDNGKGTWEDNDKKRPFDYMLNNPQSGDLCLMFNDVEETQIYVVVSINQTTLVLRRKTSSTQYIFHKQY